jgi:hypothetical protein
MKTDKKIEKSVVSGYKKIENGVVSGYKAIENGVVDGYKMIENKFTETFLTPDDDSDQDEVGINDPKH